MDAAEWQVTVDFIKRVVVHAGVHLAYWPSMVSWADDEGTKGIPRFGVELIREAQDENFVWLKSSVFGPLMRHVDI